MSGSARILLTIVATSILAAGATFLVGLPMHRRIQEDSAAIAERQSQLLALQQVSRKITDIQD